MKKKVSLILLIFFIKLFSVLYLVNLARQLNPENFVGIACTVGDAASYITPIDNFIAEGNYYYFNAKAGRMPYFGIIYFLFRILFSKTISLSILVLLQILFEAISIYFMAKLCEMIFKKRKAFLYFILFSCFSLYITTFDYYILTESFAISFLGIFSFYYYGYLVQERTNKKLFLSGIFLALATIFRPYFCILFLFVGLEFIISTLNLPLKLALKKIALNTAIVSIVLVMLIAPWTIRNYFVLKQFIPFQENAYAGYNYSNAELAQRNFIQTIGESIIFWDKRSAACYFMPAKNLDCDYVFPQKIFSQKLTMAKIEDVRNLFIAFQKTPSDSLDKIIVSKFNALSEIYKNEHVLYSKYIVPFKLCSIFLFHSGSYYLPIKTNSGTYSFFQKLIKISQSLLYYLCLIAGIIGLILLTKRNSKNLFFLFTPLYLILLFPIYFRVTEFRYFHPAFLFLSIGLVYFLILIDNYFFSKK